LPFKVTFAFLSFAFYTHFRTTFALSHFRSLHMFTFAISHFITSPRAARKENPNPNPNSHDHCLLSKWKCRTCADTHLCISLWIFSCD